MVATPRSLLRLLGLGVLGGGLLLTPPGTWSETKTSTTQAGTQVALITPPPQNQGGAYYDPAGG